MGNETEMKDEYETPTKIQRLINLSAAFESARVTSMRKVHKFRNPRFAKARQYWRGFATGCAWGRHLMNAEVKLIQNPETSVQKKDSCL